jgi:hypothetical protein
MLTILGFILMRVTGDGELVTGMLLFLGFIDFCLIGVLEEYLTAKVEKKNE